MRPILRSWKFPIVLFALLTAFWCLLKTFHLYFSTECESRLVDKVAHNNNLTPPSPLKGGSDSVLDNFSQHESPKDSLQLSPTKYDSVYEKGNAARSKLNIAGEGFEYPFYLDYIVKMTEGGCAGLRLDEPYLMTDFTDCVLFCIGRNYSKIFVKRVKEGEEKLICSCSKALEESTSISSAPSQCTASNFRIVHLRSHLPENQPTTTAAVKSDQLITSGSLGCIDTKLESLVQTIKLPVGRTPKQKYTEQMCQEYCGIQSYPLAVFTSTRIQDNRWCSCSANLTNTFKARATCRRLGTVEEFTREQILTSYATQQCERARLLTEKDPPYPITLLLSVAGSGSTWTRLLLQHITGILVGTVEYSGEKTRSGLYGESLKWTDWPQNYATTFVIRSHRFDMFDVQAKTFHDARFKLKKIIYLMRDPIKSAIAELNRVRTNNHVQSVSEKEILDPITFDQLMKQIDIHLSELQKHVREVHERGLETLYLSYEDLFENLLPQLFRIQHFFGFEDDQSIERTFCAYYKKKEYEKVKRVQKADFVPIVMSKLNKAAYEAKINQVYQFLKDNHKHILRPPTYKHD